jgi:hypothetical protein
MVLAVLALPRPCDAFADLYPGTFEPKTIFYLCRLMDGQVFNTTLDPFFSESLNLTPFNSRITLHQLTSQDVFSTNILS